MSAVLRTGAIEWMERHRLVNRLPGHTTPSVPLPFHSARDLALSETRRRSCRNAR